jgi:hypothetical protein
MIITDNEFENFITSGTAASAYDTIRTLIY